MSQIDYLSSPNPLGSDDRKGVLLVWGIILILLGAGAGCLSVATPLAVLAPRAAPGAPKPLQMKQIAGATLMYLAGAIFLIWTGIGSIRCQRWVRPIVIITSILWLITGVMGMGAAIISFSEMRGMIAGPGAPGSGGASPPPAAVSMGIAAGIGCGAILLIVLPAVMLWFYRDPRVRTTVEFYDATPRWTDRCPIPVLGMSVTLALAAFWMLPMALTGAILFFGMILTGPLAYASSALVFATLITAAWFTYQQRMSGWWLAVGLVLLFAISMTISWFTVDLRSMYVAMDTPPGQLDDMVAFAQQQRPVWFGITVLMTLVALGYAIYVRRWFRGVE